MTGSGGAFTRLTRWRDGDVQWAKQEPLTS